jgi:hypothetical protein
MEIEKASEDRCGKVRPEVKKSPAPGCLGLDTEPSKPVAKLGGCDRAAVLDTFEHPRRCEHPPGEGTVRSTLVGKPLEELVKWRGQLDLSGSEVQKGRAFQGDCYLVAAQRGDPRQLLAVEENETAGDPVGEIEVLAVKHQTCLCPAGLVVDARALLTGLAGHVEAARDLVGGSPVEEIACHGRARRSIDQPVLYVLLCAVSEFALVSVAEFQEGDCGIETAFGMTGRRPHSPSLFGALTGPAKHPPGGVGAQDPVSLDIFDFF